MATLPPLPSEVFSAYGPIPVQLVEELTDGETGEPLLGYWDPCLRTICIRAGLHPAAAWLTLWHERTHADLGGVGIRLSYNQEEAIANAIAAARVAEMLAARE